MSQHDQVIEDQSGTSFLADLNAVLAALFTNNSGATEPTVTEPFMFWADSTTGVLKMRNAADTGWVSVFNMATGALIGNAATATTSGESGSFTISCVDFTVAKSVTATWYKNNNVVHLHIPASTFTGTSDSAGFALTGIPADITPPSARVVGIANVMDNGVQGWGTVSVTSSNTISIVFEGGIWTASGVKALYGTEFSWAL